jgi:hypothetical protein
MSSAAGSVLIAFDLSTWLEGLDFTTARSEAGMLIVDESHNPDLLQRFEQHVVSGTALYRDAKASGDVDPSAAPLASGRWVSLLRISRPKRIRLNAEFVRAPLPSAAPVSMSPLRAAYGRWSQTRMTRARSRRKETE